MKYKFTAHYTTVNGRHYSNEFPGIFDTENPDTSAMGDVNEACRLLTDRILKQAYVSVDTARGKAALVTKHILMIEIVPEEIHV